jgi:signal transduction histidine kinase
LSEHLLPLAELVWSTAYEEPAAKASALAPLPVGVLLDSLRRDILEELALLGDRIEAELVVRLLLAMERLAEQLSDDPSHRFVSRFLGAAGLEALVEVAHDMRSPLSSIVLLAETLRMGQSGAVNEIQERQLSLIYGATVGLSLMANDVIELARGEERVVESAPMPFSVEGVMQAVREIVLPIAEEKGLELKMDAPAADWRTGHATALHRILLNLTTNALKFTDAGFVHVRAEQLSRTLVEFSVSDSGRGIPEHLKRTLFDAFRESDAEGRVTFSSSGLGLAICRKFVRSLGGELVVANTARGARLSFAVELPLAQRFQE